MGWCSATEIFDVAIEAADEMLENIAGSDDDPAHCDMLMREFAERIADVLWDGDWDCEEDSAHYDRFHELLCYACRKNTPDRCIRNLTTE